MYGCPLEAKHRQFAFEDPWNPSYALNYNIPGVFNAHCIVNYSSVHVPVPFWYTHRKKK